VYFSTIKLGAIFSFLFIVLGLFEIYFESPVFYSFFRESGFSNNGDNYQVGSFFVEYLDSLSKSVGIPGWIVWSIFLVASVRLIKGCLVHKKVDFIILWLVLFLIGLELLTLIGVMNRSATAGEYYRVYFNTYPLFIYIGYQQLMWLVSIINIKLDFQYRSRFKFYSLIVMGLFLLGFVQHNFSESIHRIEKSPYDGVREYSKTTINSNAEVLIIPANVYRHRKFFAHDDFSDSNITYYGDHCFKDGAKPPHLNDFDHILIVKNQRLIDKRINSKLIENGCSPDSYLENLLKESRYSKIAEFNEIEVHVR
jgi:hypothetical protein